MQDEIDLSTFSDDELRRLALPVVLNVHRELDWCRKNNATIVWSDYYVTVTADGLTVGGPVFIHAVRELKEKRRTGWRAKSAVDVKPISTRHDLLGRCREAVRLIFGSRR